MTQSWPLPCGKFYGPLKKEGCLIIEMSCLLMRPVLEVCMSLKLQKLFSKSSSVSLLFNKGVPN